MTDREKDIRDKDITSTVLRERSRLGRFILRRVRDQTEAEDILRDVFYEFVEAYRLPAPIEHASAWLFHVARNRIVDRFRKKKEQPVGEVGDSDDEASELRLDLALPAADAGPEAAYARSVLLGTSRILFGGFRGHGGWHGRRHWVRWQAMTPEEREQFQRGMSSDKRPCRRE